MRSGTARSSPVDATSTGTSVEAGTELGGLRMVVACAGGAKGSGRIIARHGTPHDLQGFVDTVQLNLVGTFNTVRLAASAMSSLDPDEDGERGAIVTVSSIAGYEGQIGQVAYGSAKAGVIGMTIIAAPNLA